MTKTGCVPAVDPIKEAEKLIGTLRQEQDKAHESLEKIIEGLIEGSSMMDEDEFWENTDHLAKLIKRRSLVGTAVDSFVWDFVFGKKDNPYKVMQYIRTYEDKVNKLYKPLFEVITGFGDDGYGDIIDSFPLHGRERFEKALKEEIEGDSEAQYQGENYMRTTLTDKFVNYYGAACLYALGKEDKEESDE